MKKILVALFAVVLLLSVVGCNKTPSDVLDNTDKDKENISVEEQLLSYDNYDVFEDEIYLCDDVYRSDDTLTHGTGSIALPMGQDVLEVKHHDILLCGDGCPPESVVSRASQGYAPVYHVVPDGEIDGNFKVLKFKMEIPEPMLEDIQKQGVYDQITERLESQYYYLLVLDEKHYAYIHLERIEGAEKLEHEAELADSIVKNARISFEPKNEKLDLTIERVIRLAENKGEELTWSDFQMYNAIDTGSGLYILVYEIDETFDLMIGGGAPVSPPMYIRLVTKADRDVYIDIRTEDVEAFIADVNSGIELCGYPTSLYFKTKNFLEQEYHRVFDPYYDIQSLTISNWEQNGNEATFYYKMTHTYYNKDPDTVDYIKKAKEEDSSRYETLYNDYLAVKEANAEYKVVLNGENLELYSNVSPKGVEWQPVKIDDYILGSN
ncbi:MAG: hypothetical protein J6B23_02745 [Clostridia bacterium]|nr:hypothetical protein [Clostridia bacterium]